MERQNLKNELEQFFQKELRSGFLEHGGDLEFLSVEDGVVRFRLLGACHNCPSATFDAEEIVAVRVREAFPEVSDVILVTGVSDDLLRQAKEILARGRKS
ncbi:MAG: NifU family protein [Fusobacteriaceae bacterium]|jgi:Fe-S cluster biogenesis protein NfuA|nr:NifU family protein [Fusobacteriaceae bacterium]